MNIKFNLDVFFDGTLGYDLKKKKEFKKNLQKCIIAGDKLNLEIEKKNQYNN